MERVQNAMNWVILVSASSHIFCCVLPTLVSLAGLLTGLGIVYAAVPAVESFHDTMHVYEVPLLMFSVSVLALGWAAQWYSWKIDCHNTGCVHEPCQPKKRRAAKILLLASVLFVLNLTVWALGLA